MTTLIVFAALASWNYDGFVSDPSPDNVPPTISSYDESHELRAESLPPTPPKRAIEEAKVEPASPPLPAAKMPGAWSPTFDASVHKWRLTDETGQLWEHEDLDVLSRWIASRNQALPNSGSSPAPSP